MVRPATAGKAPKAWALPRFGVSIRSYKKQSVKTIWGRILGLAWLKFALASLMVCLFSFSGVIINTLAYKKENKGSIINIAKAFEVDVILVLDKEPLYMALQKEFRTETRDMKIVWLPKSNGVVERGEKERSDEVHNSIKRYFYGFNNTLIPHTYDVKIDDLKDKIWKIGAPGLPDSCMPLGFKAENKDTKPVPVSLTDKELRNHVMAVSHATDEKKICETNIAGFVVVTEVDKTKDKIKILSPQPKPLPPTLLVLSPDIRFLDR
jgi:polyribonucleotide 5'-hydroxyl-kinase